MTPKVKVRTADQPVQIKTVVILWALTPVIVFVKLIHRAEFAPKRQIPAFTAQPDIFDRVPKVTSQRAILQEAPVLFAAVHMIRRSIWNCTT